MIRGTRSRAYEFWPSPTQELLMRAALLEGNAASAAFKAWASAVDLETIDSASAGLLPLLYPRLNEDGGDGESGIIRRLGGAHRQSWYRNQLILGVVSDAIDRLAAAGVLTLVLNAVAVGVRCYANPGVRPMDDADVLIPATAMGKADEVVRAVGLTPRRLTNNQLPRPATSMSFRHRDGWNLTLHTALVHQSRGGETGLGVWDSAVPLRLGRAQTLTLRPEDQFVHSVTTALRRKTVAPIIWVADATMLIRASAEAFDWVRLWTRAHDQRVELAVGRALRYLRDRIDARVPMEVMARFEASDARAPQRIEYLMRMIPGVAGLAACQAYDFLRAHQLESDWQGPLGFLHYVRDTWHLASSWHVPAAIGRKTARRLRQHLTRSSRM